MLKIDAAAAAKLPKPGANPGAIRATAADFAASAAAASVASGTASPARAERSGRVFAEVGRMPAVGRGLMLIIALCAALALAIAGCGGDDDSTSTDATSEDHAAKPAAPARTTEHEAEGRPSPSGPPPKQLEESDLVEGDGAEAKAGDEVTVQYVGVGYDSKEEFDASWGRRTVQLPARRRRGDPRLGQRRRGDEGRRPPRADDPAQPRLRPGGSPPAIGPNETLIFVVDLLAVE